jgi:hypothetical protein
MIVRPVENIACIFDAVATDECSAGFVGAGKLTVEAK